MNEPHIPLARATEVVGPLLAKFDNLIETIAPLRERIVKCNNKIWDYEDEIKRLQEGELILVEVIGRIFAHGIKKDIPFDIDYTRSAAHNNKVREFINGINRKIESRMASQDPATPGTLPATHNQGGFPMVGGKDVGPAEVEADEEDNNLADTDADLAEQFAPTGEQEEGSDSEMDANSDDESDGVDETPVAKTVKPPKMSSTTTVGTFKAEYDSYKANELWDMVGKKPLSVKRLYPGNTAAKTVTKYVVVARARHEMSDRRTPLTEVVLDKIDEYFDKRVMADSGDNYLHANNRLVRSAKGGVKAAIEMFLEGKDN